MKLGRVFWTCMALLLLGIANAMAGINVWVSATVSLYVLLGVYCSSDFKRHVVLALFTMSYFVFLVGGIFVKEYFDYDMSYHFSLQDYDYMTSSVFWGLLFVCLGYWIACPWANPRQPRSAPGVPAPLDSARRIILYSYYVLLIPYLATFAEAALVVHRHGYSEYYNYESSIPVLNWLADLYLISFCAFLATLPSKKQAKWPVAIFAVLTCASLLTGRRLFFVVDSLLLVGYFVLRNRLTPEETWISKRQAVLIVLAAPFLVMFLYIFRFIREGASSDFQSASFLDLFLSFFKQQGYSANLIPLGKIYASSLDEDAVYSFYDIIRFSRINVISRFLNDGQYMADYTGDRLNLALHSGSYARAISWAVQKWRHLQGFGMGSCYPAELLHDFGFFGLCAGSALYGATLSVLGNFSKAGFIRNTILLLMMRGFFKSPRYCYDSPYYVVFSVGLWVYLAAVFFGSRIISTPKNHPPPVQGRQ